MAEIKDKQVQFKKVKPDFNAILERQKKFEDDQKFVVSDSLQEYISTIQKTSGYQNQEKLDDAGIRQEVINFVDNYEITDLDTIKGMDYDDVNQLEKTTSKKISEFQGLYDQDVLSKPELDYIKATVGMTNDRLKEVLGLSTRFKFAFRDLKKQLKPLKLLERIGATNIPLIGKKIQQAIQAEEEGESEALRVKRGLRRREARLGRKTGGTGNFIDDAISATGSKIGGAISKGVKGMLGMSDKPELAPSGVKEFGKEEAIEEERESDVQFKTTSGLLEQLLQEQIKTNELLGGKKGGLSGLMDFAGENKELLAGIPLLFKNFRKFAARNLAKILPGFLGGNFLAKYGAKEVTEDVAQKAGVKVTQKVGETAAKEVTEKGLKEGAEKATQQATKTVATKTATQVASKGILKTVIKKIPFIGAIAGIGFALQRLAKGDTVGAGLELTSGFSSIVPGFGTAASLAQDAVLLKRDIDMEKTKESTSMRTDEITTNGVEREVNNQSSTTINQYNNRTEQNNVDNSTKQEAPQGSIGSGNPNSKFNELSSVY